MAESAEAAASVYEPGHVLDGRFRIDALLARGGMGVVYRAYDERLRRGVALKQLLAPYARRNPLLAAQFEREFHTLSQLAHPCIIAVYDYGMDAGSPYYTMELLKGQDLRRRGQMPWRQACQVLCDVGSALAILHSRRLLHRDLSVRNVVWQPGARAKLIDFGVMTPMGVPKQVVGTAPFVAPESLQLQALDGRADLYSLGALAYYMLTGTYAYPARTLAELPALLRVPPPQLRDYVSSVPEALEALVMQLLQIDRSARPRTAAEVMERLSGIAGLPLAERIEVGEAYLVTPVLLGRDAALEQTRRALQAGRRGAGSTLLLEGARGAGRSRMLDAAVLEAKLLGAVVLRADATDASAGDYAVAQVLCEQLQATLPHGERGSTAQRPPVSVRPLFAEMRSAFGSGRAFTFRGERRHVQAGLQEWFLSLTRDRHIVIAVDDADRIDEPSAALLGALAHAAHGCPLTLVLTLEQGTGATANAALKLLRQIGHAQTLAALDAVETELLLRSVFGDVPHVAALAARVFTVAEGSPGATMTLVEHLVETGVARYEAGSWALPPEIHAEQLPHSVAVALTARIARLSPDARELAEALSLIEAPGPTPDQYPVLTPHGDRGRTYRALEELRSSGVLIEAADRHRFRADEMRAALRAQLPTERARSIHARIARVLSGAEQSRGLAEHLLRAGREDDAIEAIRRRYRVGLLCDQRDVELLESAVSAAERLGLTLKVQLELQVYRLQAVATVGDRARFLRYGPPLLERALRDSGLRDLAKPENADGAPMTAARRIALERQEAQDPDARSWLPTETPAVLSLIYRAYLQIAALAQDLAIVEQLPPLDPLCDIWPSASALQAVVEITCSMQRGYSREVVARAQSLLTRLAERAGELSDATANWARQSQRFTLALFAATSGRSDARELIAEHERLPVERVNAFRVHMVYELMQGNLQRAAQCQRQAELLYLQDSGATQGPNFTTRIELLAHIYGDDLIGVKRVLDAIAERAERYPGWRSTLAVARSQYQRLRADPAGALEALQPALELAQPGRHMDWWIIAYTHLQVLCELGMAEEAASLGQSYIEIWDRGPFSAIDYGLRQLTAEALLRAGEVGKARVMADAVIATHVAAGTHGLRLGLAYETRAHIALEEQDERAVQLYSRYCGEEYQGGRHFGLLTKYARLLRDVDQRGAEPNSLPQKPAPSELAAQAEGAQTLQSMLMGCIDAVELAHTGLHALLQHSEAERGYLFLLRAGRLEQAATGETGDLETPGLVELLERQLEHALAATAPAARNAPRAIGPLARWQDSRGREFEPLLLTGKHGGNVVAVGMAALQVEPGKTRTVRRALIETLVQSLLAEHVADPIQLA